MGIMHLFKKRSINSISGSQLKEMMESSNPPLLIDVRSPQEYSSGHIPGSKNITVQLLESELSQSSIALDTPIVLYCHSGARSSHGCNILSNLGYKHVYDLGGLQNWSYGLSR